MPILNYLQAKHTYTCTYLWKYMQHGDVQNINLSPNWHLIKS